MKVIISVLACVLGGCYLGGASTKPIEAPVDTVVDVAPVETPEQDVDASDPEAVVCPYPAKFCPEGCRPAVVYANAGECRWAVVLGCSADLAHPELNPYTEVDCYVMSDGALVHAPKWDVMPDWRLCTQEEWNSMDLNFCP